ncbi:solute:sodium symporter family transporter [candidate division KSB1 bacterium]|nr:solute:sodium symporter family transporter [candidate division KSB1 bacterium]RQW07622.1 MAG: solute:sodium symporter family transporter [candidate division KSB1 bacterium]
MLTFLSFGAFTGLVAFFAWYKIRNDNLKSPDGYFLAGRSLTGVVIAGSMLLTNISTEHLIGLNGSAYRNGFPVIAWEVTSAIALIVGALYFVPRYLKMGLTTIPQYLEYRYDSLTRTIVEAFLILSFIFTLLPIVLFTGAINLESIFNISELLGVSKTEGLWLTVIMIGVVGSLYAIFGGLKAVAYSDTFNGYGLLVGGLLIPVLALLQIGDGNVLDGLLKVYHHAPEKFNVIGARDSVLPFETLFTGLIINQLYFWCMHQTIVQRALGAKSLVEAQKGLLLTGVFKILIPIIIMLPGVIGYYYFGDSLYSAQDSIYPELVKRVLPIGLHGFFAAVVMGAVLSTFNSVLNSAATIFSVGIYKKHLNKNAGEAKLVRVGKLTSSILAIFAIMVAPLVADAPEGLFQLLQQLNGIFFIPVASIILAGFFLPKISAMGAKVSIFVGLAFYVTMTFILKVNIHFVHVWGIEFILNLIVMFIFSYLYPVQRTFNITDVKVVDIQQWKYAKVTGFILLSITILIYILLGQAGR